jgi:hypothetical protein
MAMGSLSVNQQGMAMKPVAFLLLVAACALAAPLTAAMAGGGGGMVPHDEDPYEPLLPDLGGDDDGGGYHPEWADPHSSPSEAGVDEDPTPFHPSDPVGIPPNQD